MKGQSAWEYLMTYGWAVIIVIVVVMALYSMGVFTRIPEEEYDNFRSMCVRLCDGLNYTYEGMSFKNHCHCRETICDEIITIDETTFQRECDTNLYIYDVMKR
jgi:hypothetical protein